MNPDHHDHRADVTDREDPTVGQIIDAEDRFPRDPHTPAPGGAGLATEAEPVVIDADPSDGPNAAESTSPAGMRKRGLRDLRPTGQADRTPADDAPDNELGEQSAVTVLVDSPGGEAPALFRRWQEAKRRPVLPEWARSAEEFRQAARFMLGYYSHVSAYHAVRTPVYAGRLALRAPVGALRLSRTAGRWVWDAEGHPIRSAAVQRADAETYLKLSEQRNRRVFNRGLVALASLAVTVPVGWAGWDLTPAWAHWAAISTAVLALGALGRPADKPLISRAVVAGQAPKLTSETVIRALTSLGIAAMSEKYAKSVTFPAPITREGPGWRADVDLPHGVTVTDILDRRDRLASALRRNLGCVWPEGDAEQHAGRLVLWVGDKPLRETKQPAWPLRRSSADVFRPVPFGIDVRGRLVEITLIFANLLIGAMPRQGKTATLRALLLAVALDPDCELRIFELKGTGDLSVLEGCCHHYASGAGEEALQAAMASLRDLYGELEKRAMAISRLYAHNRALVPDNKVTPAVSGDRRHGLWPIVAAIDECQELFSHPDYKEDAERLATAIIKRGPALGIMLVLATQRPDKDSLPKGIADNVALRFCLKVEGQPANDMVLGTSAYQAGHRATIFTPGKDAGIGILKGATDQPIVARSFYFNGPASENIAERARALRAASGRLSGYAIGEATVTDEDTTDRLLTDILAVVPAGTDRIWSETVVDRLVEAFLDRYAAWGELETGGAKASQLAAALKPYRVRTAQTWATDPATGKGANRQGITRDAIAEALTERNRKPGGR
jgi:S-DNA-T family DNA segregation ATPase FtsK/SpoIIIE